MNAFAQRASGFLRRQATAMQLHWLQGRMRADPAKAILLFASPRGGSTWLEEILGTIPRTATIWEPLDLENVPQFRQLGFAWRQHIPTGESWPEAEELFIRLFSGGLLSPYLAQATTPMALRRADRLIVKFVRGHLLLPWITERFQVPRPVLLVRHPCAVVASMRKHGAWKGHAIPPPPPPPHRYDALVRELHGLAKGITTEEEYLAYIWCLTHAHLLHHPLNDAAWTTITYEELLLNTEATLRKVFTAWGMELPAAALEVATRPSRTTKPGSPTQDPQQQLAHWQKQLSQDQQQRIFAVLDRFGIGLYGADPMPNEACTPGWQRA